MEARIKYNGLNYIFKNKTDWDKFWRLLEQQNSINISMGAYRE